MKPTIKKSASILLLTLWGFLILYTGFMSIVFSLFGMLVTETGLMIGYIGTFLVLSASLYYTMRRTRMFNIIS